ncbi:GNAT family N-acetyltransferase [Billgrantia sp. C5P2]|uniref:GNAT family N-acetyltransferase n=1 Tax=Billgrantia sp. C5P2 TaxID=3436239 RepID=UPI003DA53213
MLPAEAKAECCGYSLEGATCECRGKQVMKTTGIVSGRLSVHQGDTLMRSARLELRYFSREDIPSIFNNYTGDLESSRYLAREPHSDIAQTERMLDRLSRQESLACFGICTWVVYSHDHEEAVGLVTAVRHGETTVLHFGIGTSYRGRGYAAEALSLAARNMLAGQQRGNVVSYVDVENIAAQKTLERAGFALKGRSEKYYKAPQLNGEHRNVFHYQFEPDALPNLNFRGTQLSDIESLFFVRERTRENAIPRERLASLGITPQSIASSLASGQLVSYVCECESTVVGFCSGDLESGEVLVLAVLSEYEGLGIGKELICRVVEALQAAGHRELWLGASPDASSRAHGFYRAQGWRADGTYDGNGDELLVLRSGS